MEGKDEIRESITSQCFVRSGLALHSPPYGLKSSQYSFALTEGQRLMY